MQSVTIQNNTVIQPAADDRPSRGEMKRQSDRLQDLGKRLMDLTAGKLARMDLPEKLQEAVVEANRLTSMGAKRRQLQFIGRIMEEFDTATIARNLRDIDFKAAKKPDAEIPERVRIAEQLITGGDAMLFETLGQKLAPDQMQLARQALRLAAKNVALGKNSRHEAVLLASKLGIR